MPNKRSRLEVLGNLKYEKDHNNTRARTIGMCVEITSHIHMVKHFKDMQAASEADYIIRFVKARSLRGHAGMLCGAYGFSIGVRSLRALLLHHLSHASYSPPPNMNPPPAIMSISLARNLTTQNMRPCYPYTKPFWGRTLCKALFPIQPRIQTRFRV